MNPPDLGPAKEAHPVELVPLRGWSEGEGIREVVLDNEQISRFLITKPYLEIFPPPTEAERREKQLKHAESVLSDGGLVLLTPQFTAFRGRSVWGLLWVYFKHWILRRRPKK